jgi:hypothetical protein
MNIKMTAKILGVLALGLTVVPPILSAIQSLGDPAMKTMMLGGCVLWFVTAPVFMKGGSE